MATVRLGAIKFRMVGFAVGVVLAAALAIYGLSVLFWSWVLMLILGACGVDWGYAQCLLPGLAMPFFLG